MQKWEYKILSSLTSDEQSLNQCGQQGWELVCMTTDLGERFGQQYCYYYLKRPID
jgi:hypothetical protein